MQRRPLSSKLIIAKIMVIIFIGVITLVLFSSPSSPEVFLPVILLMTGISYFIFYVPVYIEYNTDKMYIVRWLSTQDIDLQDIYFVQMMMTRIGQRYLWRIKFKSNGKDREVMFCERYFSTVDNFFALVQAKNPKAKFAKFSWSFDF